MSLMYQTQHKVDIESSHQSPLWAPYVTFIRDYFTVNSFLRCGVKLSVQVVHRAKDLNFS